jgi:hypothetical protein
MAWIRPPSSVSRHPNTENFFAYNWRPWRALGWASPAHTKRPMAKLHRGANCAAACCTIMLRGPWVLRVQSSSSRKICAFDVALVWATSSGKPALTNRPQSSLSGAPIVQQLAAQLCCEDLGGAGSVCLEGHAGQPASESDGPSVGPPRVKHRDYCESLLSGAKMM